MIRSVVGKVMWVGRATVFLVGLAVTLALVFGVATAALGANGDFFKLGQRNVASSVSTLVKQGAGSALALQVRADQPPLTVNAAAGTASGLSADELDGMDSSQLAPRGYARVEIDGDIVPNHSKGVIDVMKPEVGDPNSTSDNNVYCFQLDFAPHAAVGSPHVQNAADVATELQPNSAVDTFCDSPHNDAVVQTFGSTGDDAPVNFHIVFI